MVVAQFFLSYAYLLIFHLDTILFIYLNMRQILVRYEKKGNFYLNVHMFQIFQKLIHYFTFMFLHFVCDEIWRNVVFFINRIGLSSSNEIVASILFALIFGLLMWIPHHGRLISFFNYLVCTIIPLIIFLVIVIGPFIIPFALLACYFGIKYIFFTLPNFTQLPSSNLKNSIEELVTRCNFPVDQIRYHKNTVSNASTIGVLGSTLIVLNSGLLNKNANATPNNTHFNGDLTDGEILAALGHELGHWKHNDILWTMIREFVLLATCFVHIALLCTDSSFYAAFGFSKEYLPQAIRHFVAIRRVCIVYTLIYETINTAIQHNKEYKADLFACELGLGKQLISFFTKHCQWGIALPSDSWYNWYYETHPQYEERISRVSRKIEQLNIE